MIKRIEKENSIIIFFTIGAIACGVIFSIFFNTSLEFIYQYDGSMWASVSTFLGSQFAGIKAPHRKADPSATTFTMPLMASLLLVRADIAVASVSEQYANTSAFTIYNMPFIDKMVFFRRMIPRSPKSSHMIST